MEKTKAQKIGGFFAYLAALLSAMGVIFSFVGWLAYPHIEKAVMEIVDNNKGTSTRADLAEEMGVKKKDVCEELGIMFKSNSHRHAAEDMILDTWIPYLEAETEWRAIGYYVNIHDSELVKFRHWDGRDYDAWKDTQGWFYTKGGYNYYY